jgi:hypothetical protein
MPFIIRDIEGRGRTFGTHQDATSGHHHAGRHHRRPAWAEHRAGADSRSRRRSRLALCRILHRQHPQPAHPPCLRPGMRQILLLVRAARSDARREPGIRCCDIYRGPAAGALGTGRQAAARRRADAVRLADHRPGAADQPGGGRARTEAYGEDRQDAGARGRRSGASCSSQFRTRHCAICATGR